MKYVVQGLILTLCLPQVLQCKLGKLIPYVTSMPPEELDLICVSIHNIFKQVTIFYKSCIIECLLWSLDKRSHPVAADSPQMTHQQCK